MFPSTITHISRAILETDRNLQGEYTFFGQLICNCFEDGRSCMLLLKRSGRLSFNLESGSKWERLTFSDLLERVLLFIIQMTSFRMKSIIYNIKHRISPRSALFNGWQNFITAVDIVDPCSLCYEYCCLSNPGHSQILYFTNIYTECSSLQYETVYAVPHITQVQNVSASTRVTAMKNEER